MADDNPAATPTSRRWRNRLANVPVLSLLAFRWMVLYGSEVMDWAFTESAAERRAHRFVGGNVRRWNSVTIRRAGSGR